MRFCLSFIKEFIPDAPNSGEEIAQALTMAGMEVEHLEQKGDDWIFDIEVTTNRYDWLSLIGICREISACLNHSGPAKIVYPKIINKPQLSGRKVVIENLEDCLWYVGRLIGNVVIKESPSWLSQRVVNCGMKSISNAVDVTNYCMFKWGNPLHAFDADKISGDIVIRRAKDKEKFVGIDEKEYQLTNENLVVADQEKVIALAGIMGAKNSQVTAVTKNIFLEAAVFSGQTVRVSRRSVGLDTESSYRFERRVSGQYASFASQEAANMIQELAQGVFLGCTYAGRLPRFKKVTLALDCPKMNEYLGQDISIKEVKRILENLGFRLKAKSAKSKKLSVTAPDFRFDIQQSVDLYEEVARVYGLDKIKLSQPFLGYSSRLDLSAEYGARIIGLKNSLRQKLVSCAMQEIVTFSLEEKDQSAGWGIENNIGLTNPLRSQENSLRSSLLVSLAKSLSYNLSRGMKNLRIFELAHTYQIKDNKVDERDCLAMAVYGSSEDFFSAKGLLENLLAQTCAIKNFNWASQPVPGLTSSLVLSGSKTNQALAGFGLVDEKIAKHFDLSEKTFFGFCDLDILLREQARLLYQQIPLYPFVWRDISLVLDPSLPFLQVAKVIYQELGLLLAGYWVVDRYQGKDISQTAQAFTLRVSYQSHDRTLTAQEVDEIHFQLRQKLTALSGLRLR